MTKILTVGMATFRDFPGVYQTLNAIRIHQILGIQRAGWGLELVVVDNDPTGPHSDRLRRFMASIGAASKNSRKPGYDQFPQPLRVRYEPLESPTGTSPPRNKVFEIATGDAVLCVDDHIDFMPSALERFCRWADANPDSKDLLQGPMMLDGLDMFHTHFDPPFRDGMQGTWGTDYAKASYNDQEWQDIEVASKEPFDIHGQGLGVFGCLKGQWLGFNPHFREFGGEEIYIHTKYRNAGRRTLCLPFLRWPHRFDNPGKRAYALSSEGKVRNYVLGHLENGLSLEPVYKHFVLRENETGGQSRDTGVSQAIWDALVDDPERYPVLPLPSRKSVVKSSSKKGGCGCGVTYPDQQPAESTEPRQEITVIQPKRLPAPNIPPLEKRYQRHLAEKTDAAALMPKVREIVAGVQSVIEYAPGYSGVSVAATVNPGKVVWYWHKTSSGFHAIIRSQSQSTYQQFVESDQSIVADLGIVHGWYQGEDIVKSIEQLATRCDRLLILFKPNDPQLAELITVRDADKKPIKHLPGVLPVIRKLIYDHPEWSVMETRVTKDGYLYLSKLDSDRKDIKPGLLKQAATFAKAKLDLLIKDGGKYLTQEQAQPRIDLCTLCEARADNRCSECGCPLFSAKGKEGDILPGKVYHASQFCPVAKWHPIKIDAPPAQAAVPDVQSPADVSEVVPPVEPVQSDPESPEVESTTVQ